MRFALALAICLLSSIALAPAEARPRRSPPQPGLVVDVSALRARGLTIVDKYIHISIAVFTSIAARRPARLYVRITGLSLNAYAGGSGVGFRGRSAGVDSDYLEGDFQVLGPRGEVLAGRPMVVNTPASSGGAWYLPGNEQRRIEAIARIFAGWIRRYGG